MFRNDTVRLRHILDYALLRPFGPDKEKSPPILHRGLIKNPRPSLRWDMLDSRGW